MSSPFAARSTRLESCVFASYKFTCVLAIESLPTDFFSLRSNFHLVKLVNHSRDCGAIPARHQQKRYQQLLKRTASCEKFCL